MSSAGSVASELQTWMGSITQRFGTNGETGVDIGLPYHTPVYALSAGTILGTGYYGGGGVVSEQSNINYGGISGPASLYFQHLSDIVVQPGQAVQPGQLLGYSGGQLGYGDHPSTAQFSTGPHIEVGINAPYGGMWDPLGPNVNPLPFLQSLASGNLGVLGSGSGGSPAPSVQTTSLVGGVDPSTWIPAIQTAITDPLQRIGLVFFGGLLVLVGVVVLFFSSGAAAETEKTAGTAAEVAA